MSDEERVIGIAAEDVSEGDLVRVMTAGSSILSGDEVEFITGRVMEQFAENLAARSLVPVNARQHRVEIRIRDWPANSIVDINTGRAELQARGFVGVEPSLLCGDSTASLLDGLIANTNITYRTFLLQNNLLSSIIEIEEEVVGSMDYAVLSVDADINDVIRVPVINREHSLNWRDLRRPPPTIRRGKFTERVIDTAWKLLEEYMTGDQYHAFMEGTKVELQNKEETYRLIIDRKGDFMILQQKTGSGIVSSSGRIKSYEYPLGDEIAAFMDWFRFKTEELISQWNCGTYGIVKEGQRR